jgi:ATP-dependent RNA helicase HelY
MAMQVNECNGILLTEMICQNMLANLTVEEVISVLSCFINDVREKDKVAINNIQSKNVVNVVNKLEVIADTYIKEEEKIKYVNKEFWEISYDYVNMCYRWANGESIIEILGGTEIYEADFIKAILKLNNIGKDLIGLSKIYGDVSNIPIFEQIPDKLIRGLVNIDSLYIRN